VISATVIGSYPAGLDAKKHARNYFEKRIEDPAEDMIKDAVDKQIEAGVDIISDGQTRGDFVKIFTEKFRGVVVERRPVVISEIEYTTPVSLDDLKYASKIAGKKAQVKGILTGPYTLAKSCENRYYADLRELTLAFAEALNKEAKAIEPHVSMLQVDEPFFSVDYPEYAHEVIEIVRKGVKKTFGLHSCGDVSDVFAKLVEFPVDILYHEFAANPELLGVVKEIVFSQKIGFGCVRSDSDVVEKVEVIAANIQNAVDIIGGDRLLVNPDCGLRNLSEEIAFKKLCNMVKARDKVCGE